MSSLYIIDLTELSIKDCDKNEKKPLTLDLWEKNRLKCIFTNIPPHICGKGKINIHHLDNYINKALNHHFVINEII